MSGATFPAFAAPALPGLSPLHRQHALRSHPSPASPSLSPPRRRTRVRPLHHPHPHIHSPSQVPPAARRAPRAVAHENDDRPNQHQQHQQKQHQQQQQHRSQQQPRQRTARLAVLASGSGRSLANLLSAVRTNRLTRCEVAVVVASKSTAGALDHAAAHDVPSRVVKRKDFADDEHDVDVAFSNAVARVLDEFEVDLVVMAGWMHFFNIPHRYLGRVINIHPSLIPAFSGKGFYGSLVHDAVVKAGVKVTGCTVHLADNIYDHGPIILQRTAPVHAHDTVDDIASRVFEQELIALPDAVQLFVDGRLEVRDNVVHVLPAVNAAASARTTAEADA